MTSRRKQLETCANDATDISERLRLLSLPNSHLVEAVLKEHSHVFTDDCRDRLRNLLQMIVDVNTSTKRKFDKLDENLRTVSCKNWEERLKDIRAKKTHEARAQTESPAVDADAPKTSSMVCNVSSTEFQQEPRLDRAGILRGQSANDPKGPCFGDADSNIEVLFEGLIALSEERAPDAGDPVEAAGGKESERLSRKDTQIIDKKPRRTASLIPRRIRSRNLSTPCEEEEAKKNRKKKKAAPAPRRRSAPNPSPERRRRQSRSRETTRTVLAARTKPPAPPPPPPPGAAAEEREAAPQSVINVPSLAVRAYVALIMDMQRNCALYESFRKNLIKPIELYKEPYMKAAYNCWMDYMTYVKNTLDYLHPYIMNLVHAHYTRDRNDPVLREFGTRLPKVLVNSVKSIKAWRTALQEAVECSGRLFADEVARADALKLYERYYEKIGGLPKICVRRAIRHR